MPIEKNTGRCGGLSLHPRLYPKLLFHTTFRLVKKKKVLLFCYAPGF